MHLIYTWMELLKCGMLLVQVAPSSCLVLCLLIQPALSLACIKSMMLKRIRISLDSAVLWVIEVRDQNKAGPILKGAEQLHPLYE